MKRNSYGLMEDLLNGLLIASTALVYVVIHQIQLENQGLAFQHKKLGIPPLMIGPSELEKKLEQQKLARAAEIDIADLGPALNASDDYCKGGDSDES